MNDKRAGFRFLPPVGSVRYHLLLSAVAIFVLGPLGGIAASYMNFSLGFFIGGQVLAGILGSAVTYGYGPEGKHGANYMQTMAASVAGLSAMGVLIQAMVWLGMDLPAAWQLMLFFGCVGMFGVGVGMMYTPLLVDRLALTYPSGLAVANILRALTDKQLLKRSVGQLGGGIASGVLGAAIVEHVKIAAGAGLSMSSLGTGVIIASRIAVPGLVMAAVGALLTPLLRANGWLGPDDPFRKIGFLMGLAMILGAAIVDLTLIGSRAWQRLRETRVRATEHEARSPDGGMSMRRLTVWVLFWGLLVVLVGWRVLGQSPWFLGFAVLLSVIFVLINGISTGVSDSNPISSAFVISIMLMSGLGLRDPITALIAASVLLVACGVGVDMQQDRSTGARLGTNRTVQFRYQVIGIVMGAILAVVLAHAFMHFYPVLKVNTFDNPKAAVEKWQSAMTFKFVGAIRDLGNLPGYKLVVLGVATGFGFVTELARKLLAQNRRYQALRSAGRTGFVFGWFMDAVVLASPYALSFGGFVELKVAVWYSLGGCITSLVNTWSASRTGQKNAKLPEDMSTMSLIGGGLVAGEALFALGVGIYGLLHLWLR
jgi:uncharacterized oligopeptide transporter (OPT) family protein